MSKDIIRMAREAGVHVYPEFEKAFEMFADLIRADEREACLDLAESYAKNNTELRDAIRARGAK